MASTQDRLLEQLQEVDAYEFEQFVAKLWELQNWKTRVTKGSDDGGIDVIAEKSRPFPEKQVIQVKRYEPSASVGRPEIQQYASLRQERTGVDTVVVVTTGKFTDGAREVGRKLNVKLINGPQLYNLIDALDAFEIARSYIDPESGQSGITLTTDTEPIDAPLEKANAVDNSHSITEIEEDTQIKDVPTLLPNLIKLRGEIIDHIQAIQSNLNSAEEAFSGQRYFDAVERYEEISRQQTELKREISRYDAGLTQIDSNTVDHLPSTETYTNHLAQITERISENFREAFRITERAKGLELLVSEIRDRVDTIEEFIEHGDRMRQQGEVEKAHLKYKNAQHRLEQARQTMEVYQGLVTEYENKIIESHSGLPQGISLSELESEISSRMDSREEYMEIPQIAKEAAGSFSASLLTNNGGLFDKELIEYLEDDEQLEFVFEPPRMGFKIVLSDGTEETYHETYESGSCFLLITDQRILYIAGVDDHDETWTFEFGQLSGVVASTDATSPGLVFSSVEGEKYKFAGLRTNITDLEAAANFLDTQLE